MNKKDKKELELRREIDRLEKERSKYSHDDPFTSEPIFIINKRYEFTKKINELRNELDSLGV